VKLIDSFLYLEFDEAVQAGIGSEGYLRKAKSVGSGSFTFINDPSDKRKVLLQFETLKPQHKALVEKRYGNPYDRLAKEPIKNLVSKDTKAEEFIYPTGIVIIKCSQLRQSTNTLKRQVGSICL
jgi:hypothetical protein